MQGHRETLGMSAFFHRFTLSIAVLFPLAFSVQLFAQESGDRDKAAGSPAAAEPNAQGAEAAQQKTTETEAEQPPKRIHMVPWGHRARPVKTQNKPNGLQSNNGVVQYWGGPVISNVQVIEVLWGSFVATSELTGPPPTTMDTFFTDITQSSWYDLLTEYSTINLVGFGGTGGTHQTIGHGTFGVKVTITPSVCPGGSTNPACTVTDTQIQTELVNQINGGKLPQPVTDAPSGTFNTIYMIFFPPNVTIELDPKTKSCQNGGFCAYHSNVVSGSFMVPYGVHPDFSQGGCAPSQGCGNGSAFNNLTSASSHELAEAVSDVDVGSATVFAPPLGWADQNTGEEIGDFCNQFEALVTVNGNSYQVQTIASNMQTKAQSLNGVACVARPAVFGTNTPTNAVPGSPFTLTLDAQSSVDGSFLTAYSDTVHFTSSDPGASLPADYTFTAGDRGSHTFNITLNTTGTQTVTATDTLMAPITVSPSFNVQNSPDLTVISSHTGNFTQGQTGATYTLTASNVGNQATTGTVTVNDNLPAGLTPTAMSGTGWSCTVAALSCNRSDALAAHSAYPVITLTVNVANNAAQIGRAHV